MMLLIRMILTLTAFSLISLRLISATTAPGYEYQKQHKFNNFTSLSLVQGQSRSLLLSPTPDEYNELYAVACRKGRYNNGTSLQPMSKEELIDYYSKSNNERLKQVASKYRIYQECRREPTSWRYHYIDEAGQVLIRERSIDERSANVLYLVRSVKAISLDIFSYDWEDPHKDEINRNRVVGPKYNDDLCGKQLSQMQALADDLTERAAQLRAANSSASSAPNSIELTDQHISLAKILDSFGRYESGRLFGKIYSAGSYYQCIWNKLILSPEEKIGMRFCWAHLSYEKHLAESLRTRRRSKYEHPTNVLYSGICLPESCHSKSYDRHKEAIQRLIDSQFTMPLSTYVDEHLDLSSLYCLVDEESEFRVPLAGKCLLAFIAGWCLLTLLVTVWNATIGKKTSSVWREERRISFEKTGKRANSVSILEGLDLLESWKDFITHYSSFSRSRAVQLDAIDFFKVFGCAFVVFGHTMAVFGGFAMDEIRVAKFIEGDTMLCLILAGTLVVDTFFVISGILWAYFALKRLNGRSSEQLPDSGHLQTNLSAMKQTIDLSRTDSNSKEEERKSFSPVTIVETATSPTDRGKVTIVEIESWYTTIKVFCFRWVTYTGFRYLRIVPLYVLVHWFKKYVYIYAGSGPYWDHGFNYKSMNGACHKESPLVPFTFLAAYLPISRQCTLQSWSIANDLFFAILAPPVILLINKRPKIAACLSIISCMGSYGFALEKISTMPTYVDEEMRELRSVGFYRFFDDLSLLYTAPHFRVFNFLAGIWGGYALFYKQAKIEKRQALEQRNNDIPDQISVELSPRVNDNKVVSERIEWPNWFRGPATWMAFSYMFTVFLCFGMNETFKQNSFGLYRLVYPQFVTSMRVSWALANVVIFLRMMTDWKDKLVMRWSASKFWQVFSKLNYAILLIHLDLLLYTITGATSLPTSFTKWSFFSLGAGIFMLSVPLAMLVYVVFENPIDKLIRSWVPR
uniref:Nose resistant-to-fluoxetine protein N-terminal domain-containing protein n=1 Tax=Aceria tosichella TaxID=561515 RepID=A0A6G1SJQ8_9ACAR